MRPEDIPSLATLELELNLSVFSNRDINDIFTIFSQRRHLLESISTNKQTKSRTGRSNVCSFYCIRYCTDVKVGEH